MEPNHRPTARRRPHQAASRADLFVLRGFQDGRTGVNHALRADRLDIIAIEHIGPRNYTVAWFLRLLGLATPVAVLALVIAVGPAWFSGAAPRIPPPSNRDLLARALGRANRTLRRLAGFRDAGLRMAHASGMAEAGERPSVERGFLLGLSCLVALLGLEVGATAWRAWIHRPPRLPTSFAASPPDEYRIVVLGGSSALGEPYRPWLSVGQIVAWKLRQAVPEPPVCLRDPRVAGPFAGTAASQTRRNRTKTRRGDHLLRPQ